MKQDSWLYSDSFLKRAFAIWGYNAVAGLIIMIPFMILWTVFASLIFTSVMRTMGPGMQEPEMTNEEMIDLQQQMMMELQNQ